MQRSASYWPSYILQNKILQVDLWMETLPRIAAEVAAPMSQCEKVSMVMDLGSDPGTDGPSKLTQEVSSLSLFIIGNLYRTYYHYLNLTLYAGDGHHDPDPRVRGGFHWCQPPAHHSVAKQWTPSTFMFLVQTITSLRCLLPVT